MRIRRLVLCQCGMQPLPPCFDTHTIDHIDAHDCSSSKQHSTQHTVPQHGLERSLKNTAIVENKQVYKGCLLLPCIEEETAVNSDSVSNTSVSSGSSSNKRDTAAAEAAHKVCTMFILEM
jgi:hypothetical protein